MADLPRANAGEVALTQRLLDKCVGVPLHYRVTVRAGELLALLQALAATAGHQAKPLRPVRDAIWPKVEAYLRQRPAGSKLVAIARDLGLDKRSVLGALRRHGCEKMPNTFLWRLSASSPCREGATNAGSEQEEKRIDRDQ